MKGWIAWPFFTTHSNRVWTILVMWIGYSVLIVIIVVLFIIIFLVVIHILVILITLKPVGCVTFLRGGSWLWSNDLFECLLSRNILNYRFRAIDYSTGHGRCKALLVASLWNRHDCNGRSPSLNGLFFNWLLDQSWCHARCSLCHSLLNCVGLWAFVHIGSGNYWILLNYLGWFLHFSDNVCWLVLLLLIH